MLREAMTPTLQSRAGRILLILAGLLTACSTFNAGSPIASTYAPAASASRALDVAVETFAGLGFKVASLEDDSVAMDRPASKTGQVLYGNWNESVSLERVVIKVTPGKADLYKIACFPYAVRNAGTGMEDVIRRVQFNSWEYSRALREIARRLRAVDRAPADAAPR